MKTIGTRELKQNPNTVIELVRESGEEFEITSYGRPTGVRIVPVRPGPRRWVTGASLADVQPMAPGRVASWREDIERSPSGEVLDPWEQA
ncbi:type II toxin-antitoxin system Phd/YefM family antitoxin [Microlunatus elymi]|uniref:Antitoxin n=1 Tax=Microlunatus elymi TaxID=2596828 RepID=A0A516Q536_9ACTN|nr:type II toxin-antitoxin system Phd/YefM family antitoxin [Microlunatus elymi]QDP98331.1 type II toxin-antitoxin system Phd/YefM family antitoxin [Microlunatus elymi]